jgi:hypothetical protein
MVNDSFITKDSVSLILTPGMVWYTLTIDTNVVRQNNPFSEIIQILSAERKL